jgi:RNA polymerase sigma-70 factor (ECF subfamily)
MNNNNQGTRASLLLQLRDAQNAAAWEQFVAIYTPLIFWFCCRQGLQEADAADVSQEVMRAVARAMQSFDYDPRRGKFRNWLLTVVRSKVSNLLRNRQRQPEPAGQSTVQALADQARACRAKHRASAGRPAGGSQPRFRLGR